MRSSTFMGAVCAGLIGLYIGVSHIGAPVSVPIERMTLGPAASGRGPITSGVPGLNPPAAVGKKTVKAPSSNQSIGAANSDVHPSSGVTPAPVITTTEPTSTPTVAAKTVSLKTVTPKPVSPKPVAQEPVTKPVAQKPPPEKPPAPKPVVQPPDEPIPPTVVPPTVVPPKDGVDGGLDGVDLGVTPHASCDHGDQKDEPSHDGYGSPDGSSHGDGEAESDGHDHGPKYDGPRHDDPAQAETDQTNANAPTSGLGVVSNALVGSPEGG